MARLADSMARLGLRTPISIRMDGDDLVLVAGRHRLEAAKRLGWEYIDAFVVDDTQAEAEKWEIIENLHRAELLPVDRAEQTARLVEIMAAGVSRHDVGKLGRPEGGAAAAARELGVNERSIQRAIKIAGLPQETRDQARQEEWSQKRLLEAAAPPAPKPVRLAPAIKNALDDSHIIQASSQ